MTTMDTRRAVVKLNETVTSSTIVPQYDGSLVTQDIECSLYRCEGRIASTDQKCMLVWDRFKHAVGCAERGHRNRFYDSYYRQIQNGDGLPPSVTEERFVRVARRRDGVRPSALTQVQAPVSTPTPVTPAPADPVAELKAAALALGFRLSKVPTPKEVFVPQDQGSDEPAF